MNQMIEFLIMLIFDIILILPIIFIVKTIKNKINKIRKENEEIEAKNRKEELDYLAKQIAAEQAKTAQCTKDLVPSTAHEHLMEP